MRSRRTAQDELAAVARRRLEMLSRELAEISGTSPPREPQHPDGLEEDRLDTQDERSAELGLQLDDEGLWRAEAPTRGRHARRPVAAADRVGSWVHDRLPPTLQGRVRLSAGHVAVVAILVAGGFAVTAWWTVRADGGTPVPAAAWSEAAQTTDASESPLMVTPVADASGSPAADGEPTVLVVDVAGKVRRPGIATLPVGSRVVDALEAAGGPRRGVDLSTLNLARLLVDGEQILVGVPPPGGVAAPAAGAAGTATSGSPGSMVNLNAATQAELEELPGVGPVTAAAILQWRTDNGPFTAVDELLEVSGIGDATLAKIAPYVTL